MTELNRGGWDFSAAGGAPAGNLDVLTGDAPAGRRRQPRRPGMAAARPTVPDPSGATGSGRWSEASGRR